MISTVTTKGQVTIPVEIRSRFHINPSDRVDFIIDGDRIIIIPIKTLKQLRGSVAAVNNGNISSERQSAKQVLSRKMAEEMA
jgi:AbrB family looped-hinge helix DNA binding protein